MKQLIYTSARFFYAGLRAGPHGPRAYAGRVYAGMRAHCPGPPRIFSMGRPDGPGPNCHP